VRLLRRLFRLLTLAALVAGAVVAVRRLFGGERVRADLYYEDGSMTSLEGGSPGSEQLFVLAAEALEAARAA
jgi:hypothetical protein